MNSEVQDYESGIDAIAEVDDAAPASAIGNASRQIDRWRVEDFVRALGIGDGIVEAVIDAPLIGVGAIVAPGARTGAFVGQAVGVSGVRKTGAVGRIVRRDNIEALNRFDGCFGVREVPSMWPAGLADQVGDIDGGGGVIGAIERTRVRQQVAGTERDLSAGAKRKRKRDGEKVEAEFYRWSHRFCSPFLRHGREIR